MNQAAIDEELLDLYDAWQHLSAIDKIILWWGARLEVTRRNKITLLILSTVLAAGVMWGIYQDPFAVAVGLLIGLFLGISIMLLYR